MEQELLQLGTTVTGTAQEGQIKVYKFEVLDNTQMLTILAEPADENSDPDIYLNYNHPKVGQHKFLWKSANIGADKIELHPNDQQYQPGTYYLGVLAYKPGLNTFNITTFYTPIQEIIELTDQWTGEITNQQYFQFEIQNASKSRLEITVTPGKGRFVIFVSSSVYYPNEEDHQWSIGKYELDQYSQMFEDYGIDIDPYDSVMKREYTRKATGQELQRLIAENTQEADSDSEEIRQPMNNLQIQDQDETLRFCIETDEWKYSAKICYATVQNLTEQPTVVTVAKREVAEDSMLSPEICSKLEWFKDVFVKSEGSSISQKERRRMNLQQASEFTYGEIEFIHLNPVLELCKPQPGEVFWDLGCGAGKCLLAVSILYPQLGQVKGVEMLDGLYSLAQENIANIQSPFEMAPIQLYHGDMLRVDWSDADIIFTSSICFPDQLIEGIAQKARRLKKGARIITLKSFPPNAVGFEVIHNLRVKMTWGKTGVYVLEKVI